MKTASTFHSAIFVLFSLRCSTCDVTMHSLLSSKRGVVHMTNKTPFTMKEVGLKILQTLSERRADDNDFSVRYAKPYKKDVFTRIALKDNFNLDLINNKQIDLLMRFLTEALEQAGYSHSELTLKLSGCFEGGGRMPQINGIFYHKYKSFAVFEITLASKKFDTVAEINFAEIQSKFAKLIDQFPAKQLMMHASSNNQPTTEKHYEYEAGGVRQTISPEALKELEESARHKPA